MIHQLSNEEIVARYYKHSEELVTGLRRMLCILRLLDGRPVDADRLRRLLVEGYGYPNCLVTWHRDIDTLSELGMTEFDTASWEISRKRDSDFWPFSS